MGKGYEVFIQKLQQALMVATGIPKEKFYFDKCAEKEDRAGDRLFVECAEYEDACEVCGIYTGELYDRYLQEDGLEGIVQSVLREMDKVKKAGFYQKTRNLAHYETARPDLFIRVINLERNKEDLKDAIYRTLGDMAMVLYMKVGEIEGYTTSLKIRQEYIDKWDVNREKVFDDALLNTSRISPPRLYWWEKLMFDEDYQGEDFMGTDTGCRMRRNALGNCLSTVRRSGGAVAIFLPGVAARIGELIRQDFYIVFTSVHEVMIHNAACVSPENLVPILADTLREVTPQEEWLSTCVYHYSRESGLFSCVASIPPEMLAEDDGEG